MLRPHTGLSKKKDQAIKLGEKRPRKTKESLSKMMTKRDDLKAEVAARDGTIEDLEQKIFDRVAVKFENVPSPFLLNHGHVPMHFVFAKLF